MAFQKILNRYRSIFLIAIFFVTTVLFLQAGRGQATDADISTDKADVIATGKADLAKGQEYYHVCSTCHGRRAEGSLALGAPKLAGQYDWYLVRQLENFRDGVRGRHENDVYGQTMASMAPVLGDDQAIQEVVAYITTLPVQ